MAFHSLKAELDAEMSKVHQQLEGIGNKLRANIHSEENSEGLLVQRERDYLECLELKHR